MKNAKYFSPRTQNEILEVLGKHIILKNIVNEVKKAVFYSVLAYEVSSHNREHLALCIRFVDDKKAVREEFLGFVELERITGEEIAATIVRFLNENGIPIAGMRGQGYDGASNMSSDRVGVQKRIRELAPQATYVHCHSHCLNLVITKSCSLPDIHSTIGRLQHCCHFFLNSPKRSGVLQLIVSKNVSDTQGRKPLLDICKMRWVERHTAYQHFYQAYTYIVEALEVISYGRHIDKYSERFGQWDPANRSEAQQILVAITSSTFLVGFMCVYQYLSHLSGITLKLQCRAQNILEAHQLISEVQDLYEKECQAVDDNFQLIYQQCERLAEKIGCEIAIPPITGRQQHRSNPPSASPLNYFKRTVAIPFLDFIVSSLEERFSRFAVIATSLLSLVPSVLCTQDVILDSVVTATAKTSTPQNCCQLKSAGGSLGNYLCQSNSGQLHQLRLLKNVTRIFSRTYLPSCNSHAPFL